MTSAPSRPPGLFPELSASVLERACLEASEYLGFAADESLWLRAQGTHGWTFDIIARPRVRSEEPVLEDYRSDLPGGALIKRLKRCCYERLPTHAALSI
jgi:hypothetical protein